MSAGGRSDHLPGELRLAVQQALFDVIPSQIAVLDPSGKILATNRAWESAQGTDASATFLQPGDQPDYLLMWERALGEGRDHAQAVLELVRAVLNGQQHSGNVCYWRGASSGIARWFQLTAQSLPDGCGAMVLHEDISGEKRSETEVLRVSERERRIISQDLHDGLCQHLGGVALLARSFANGLARAGRTEAELARQLSELVNDAVGQTRAVARALHPMQYDNDGLVSALHELALQTQAHVPCELQVINPPIAVEKPVSASLYRIAQEALKNALQHATASHIKIQLRQTPTHLVMMIEDNGRGLNASPSRRTMGLTLMGAHARSIDAELELLQPKTGGTRVRCKVPLPSGAGTPAKPASASRPAPRAHLNRDTPNGLECQTKQNPPGLVRRSPGHSI